MTTKRLESSYSAQFGKQLFTFLFFLLSLWCALRFRPSVFIGSDRAVVAHASVRLRIVVVLEVIDMTIH
jgi:hypothetical protein